MKMFKLIYDVNQKYILSKYVGVSGQCMKFCSTAVIVCMFIHKCYMYMYILYMFYHTYMMKTESLGS